MFASPPASIKSSRVHSTGFPLDIMEPTPPPEGYHKLADLMSQYSETAIFRRFSSLSMLSILSLQAELVELQDDFRIICREDDSDASSPDKDFSRYFHKLRASRDGVNDEQLKHLRAIRMKLAEYSECVQDECIHTPSDAKSCRCHGAPSSTNDETRSSRES